MKRFLTVCLLLLISASFIYAADEGDEYDDGITYQRNDKGDQFIKIDAMALFPLNFGTQLYVGGAIDLGYYRFLNTLFAIGGEITATYNVSIGSKSLVMVPLTLGAMVVPSIGNFEFPISLGLGIGYETWNSKNYFPSFALKATAGADYRVNDAWSFGISSSFLYIPQFYTNSYQSYNSLYYKTPDVHGLFLTAALGMKYHF